MASEGTDGLLERLGTGLRNRYAQQFKNILPKPFLHQVRANIGTLYVEPDVEEETPKLRPSKLPKKHSTSAILSKFLEERRHRIFIEGAPGMGKSMMCLQLVFEWYNKSKQSPMSKVQLLIFLRLRQLQGIQSLSDAIKQLLLPKDSKLSDEDIKSILTDQSPLIIFDAYDEYPDHSDTEPTFVMDILRKDSFKNSTVITTTRYVPQFAKVDGTIRIQGLSNSAQNQYIMKTLDCDHLEVQRILNGIRKNSILSGLCETTLLFVLLTHTAHSLKDFSRLNSATNLIRACVKCFFDHLKNKGRDKNVKMIKDTFEVSHAPLDEFCFNSLTKWKNSNNTWKQRDMKKEIGDGLYQYYVDVGILIESEIMEKQMVQFYHNLFCSWFASFHLLKEEPQDISKFLSTHQDFHLYLLRFSSGLNSAVGTQIVTDLKESGLTAVATLCLLEIEGDLVNVKDNIKQFCEKEVVVDAASGMLMQLSQVYLCEIASYLQVPISRLKFKDVYVSCKQGEPAVYQLKTEKFPETDISLQIDTMIKTEFSFSARQRMSHKNIKDMISFSTKSRKIEEIIFSGCVNPVKLHESVSSMVHARKIKVRWTYQAFTSYHYLGKTGRWINGQTDKELDEQTYDVFTTALSTPAVKIDVVNLAGTIP